jgi:hypothetical protein
MNKEKPFDRMSVEHPLIYLLTIFLYSFGALSLADDLMSLTFSTPGLTVLPALIGKCIGSLFIAVFLFLYARRNMKRAAASGV